MATRKNDPTISSETAEKAPAYPEGTHPARTPSETDFAPGRFEYKDNPDKPDASSIAQIEVIPDEK